MHDRRIDGKTVTFGNASSLYMSAMTWWDHDTRSVWSQPWGRAIEGELKGTSLFLLPSQIATWESWQTKYPHTLVMTNDIELMPRRRVSFDDYFVIGVTLADQAKAYRFGEVQAQAVVNDSLGDVPVMIWAQDNSFHAYIRDIGDQTLTFFVQGGQLMDQETGSTWNVARGLAESGPLRGQVLQALPSLTAYEDHWFDFYPDSTVWVAGGG